MDHTDYMWIKCKWNVPSSAALSPRFVLKEALAEQIVEFNKILEFESDDKRRQHAALVKMAAQKSRGKTEITELVIGQAWAQTRAKDPSNNEESDLINFQT